jgi:SAM-dependent methyltransferase
MKYLQHNRRAWNKESREGSAWCSPVDSETIRRAQSGDWQIILTPRLPVPRPWFGNIAGKRVLCLASAGGQQAPILSAAGAKVVSFDLSEEQLAKDQLVAGRDGLLLACVQGDMADLSCFDDEQFDLVFHPASNVFVPDVLPVWKECFRVLRPNGVLLSGFMNPVVFLFDHEEAKRTGKLEVRYQLPYSDVTNLPPALLQEKIGRGESIEFGHSLDALIGGQLQAGFLIAGLYEDKWFDDTWLFSRYCPICIATRSIKRER